MDNVQIWDPLLGDSHNPIQSIVCVRSGASALCVVEHSDTLIVGSTRGTIHILSLSHPGTLLHKIRKAHHGRIYSIVYDRAGDVFITGGQDGCVRVYSASGYHLLASYSLFVKKTFFNHPSCHDMVSTFGVTDIAVTPKYLVCSGADGSVKYLHRRYL